MRRARPRVLAAGVVLVMLAACGSSSPSDDSERAGAAEPKTELRVFAASSLTEVLEAHKAGFERSNPRVEVSFSFGGSSVLAQQILDGNPFDVFVSADARSMDQLVDADEVRAPRVVARNQLALLVERDNPKDIMELSDLSRGDVVLVMCASTVPCGRLGDAVLDNAGVRTTPASREPNVKAVVAKVLLGEADAGIVYRTDVKAAAGRATGIAISGADDPSLLAVYSGAVATHAASPSTADAWLESLVSEHGRSVLAEAGFLAP